MDTEQTAIFRKKQRADTRRYEREKKQVEVVARAIAEMRCKCDPGAMAILPNETRLPGGYVVVSSWKPQPLWMFFEHEARMAIYAMRRPQIKNNGEGRRAPPNC